jgi:glycosyltransferase involved in cell wall biosynthesis
MLSLIIKGLVARGYQIDLYTSLNRSGFLSNIEGVKSHYIYYEFSKNKLKTTFFLIYAQVTSFLAVFRYCFKKDVIIYINTIYPFGAALGAVITRKRLIYHVHEKPVIQSIISSFALIILNKFAQKAIFVSRYLYDNSSLRKEKKELVYNALSPEFTLRAEQFVHDSITYNILMICSLRKFKGVLEFVEIASVLSKYSFTLVVNGTDEEIVSFFRGLDLPKNLEIFSSKTDVHPFYEKANLVLNLSLPDLWVESFGLTVLEAMSYGIPVIVPQVGGIAELVEDGINGYKVDARDKEVLISTINQICSDNAKKKAGFFSYAKMIDGVVKTLH